MKALPVDVFRHSHGDCTNNGVSSRYETLYLICDEGFVDVDENNPPDNLVKLVKRNFPWHKDPIYHIEPFVDPEGAGWMMGGNYAATSDSRFQRMVGDMYGAVPIHDRQETYEMYEFSSR